MVEVDEDHLLARVVPPPFLLLAEVPVLDAESAPSPASLPFAAARLHTVGAGGIGLAAPGDVRGLTPRRNRLRHPRRVHGLQDPWEVPARGEPIGVGPSRLGPRPSHVPPAVEGRELLEALSHVGQILVQDPGDLVRLALEVLELLLVPTPAELVDQ